MEPIDINELIETRNQLQQEKYKLLSEINKLSNTISEINRILYTECKHEYYRDYSTYALDLVCKKCSHTISK